MRNVVPLDVVETIREGLLVLEPDLTIRFANRSFCHTFAVSPKDDGRQEAVRARRRTVGHSQAANRRSRQSFPVEKPLRLSKSTTSFRQSVGA